MGNVRWAVALLVLCVIAASALAFAGRPGQQHAPHVTQAALHPGQSVEAANPEDVQSMDSIIAALYDVISGPAGQRRNWDRLRSLFVPGARLIALGHGPNGDTTTHHFTVEEYISRAAPIFDREGFYENEIARHADAYNHMAQVFSAYESRHAQGEKAFQRGINAIQLLNDGQRWWVVNIFWENETPGHSIPKKYLHPRRNG